MRALAFISSFLWCVMALSTAAVQYQVQELGKTLEIKTPGGKKVFFSNFGFDSSRDYRVVIPLDALTKDGKVGNERAVPKQVQEPESDDEELVDDDDEQVSDRQPDSVDPVLDQAISDQPAKRSAETKSEYDDTDRLIVEANHFYNRGKFFEATLCIEELIRKKPTLARAWIMKGSLMHVQGQRDLARAAWEKALSLEPGNIQIKDYLARYK